MLQYQIGPADCTALGNAYEHAAKFKLPELLEVDRAIFSMKLYKRSEMPPSDLARSLCAVYDLSLIIESFANMMMP